MERMYLREIRGNGWREMWKDRFGFDLDWKIIDIILKSLVL